MDQGYWLNVKSGKYVSSFEHAMDAKNSQIAKEMGLPKSVSKAIEPLHPADETKRVEICLAVMNAGFIRVRSHGTYIAFEFTCPAEEALWAAFEFLKKTQLAGPFSVLRFSNLRTNEGNDIRFDTFEMQMQEDAAGVMRIAKSLISIKLNYGKHGIKNS